MREKMITVAELTLMKERRDALKGALQAAFDSWFAALAIERSIMIPRAELIRLLSKVVAEADEAVRGGWEDAETGEPVRQITLHEGLIANINDALDNEYRRRKGLA